MNEATTAASAGRERRRVTRVTWPDAVFGSLAVLIASSSLAFPFGRDQGLFYYVGREWLERGAIPYKDVFEQKTPGVFMLHALSIALFGEQAYGIRIFELVCVAALGLACASAVAPRGQPPPSGIRGVSVLAASVFYFGMLDFWDTAQCEIWCTTAAIVAFVAATRVAGERKAAFLAGVFGGFAVVMKPPGMWMVAVVAIIAIGRVYGKGAPSLRRMAIAAASFASGFVLVVGALLAYFAAHGALEAMYDVVIRANFYYREHETWAHTASTMAPILVDMDRTVEPTSGLMTGLLAAAVVVAVRIRDRAMLHRYVVTAALLAGALAGVLMQLKLYAYHFGLCEGPLVLLAANVVFDAERLARRRYGERRPWAAPCAVAAVILAAFALTRQRASTWWNESAETLARVTGRISHEQYSAFFALPKVFYDYRPNEELGLWLRENTKPSDTVSVRGFEPEIYMVSRRHRVGRFFWTYSLASPGRGYRREEWLQEEHDALLAHPPTWVLAPSWAHDGCESAEYFYALGYERVTEMNGFIILRRSGA